jgi:hypothetical protein
MLKNILNATGAQELSKVEQQTINGGAPVRIQTFCSNARPTAPWSCTSIGRCSNGKPAWACNRN